MQFISSGRHFTVSDPERPVLRQLLVHEQSGQGYDQLLLQCHLHRLGDRRGAYQGLACTERCLHDDG